MTEYVLQGSSRDSEKNACKTITATGEIQSALEVDSVYRVSERVVLKYAGEARMAGDVAKRPVCC